MLDVSLILECLVGGFKCVLCQGNVLWSNSSLVIFEPLEACYNRKGTLNWMGVPYSILTKVGLMSYSLKVSWYKLFYWWAHGTHPLMANSQVQYFKACSNTRTVNTRFLKLTEVFQLWNFQHTVVIAYKQLTLNANSDQLLYVLNRNAVIGQSSFALLSGLTGLLRWWGGHTPSGVARIPEKRNMSALSFFSGSQLFPFSSTSDLCWFLSPYGLHTTRRFNADLTTGPSSNKGAQTPFATPMHSPVESSHRST